jgi:hypothetical protein
MQPRYEPTYNNNSREEFIGYAGDIDVWTERSDDYTNEKEQWVILVGPQERKLRYDVDHNFDVYPVRGNVLSDTYIEQDGKDLHVELPEMCQVYQLCVERGYITTE